MSGARSRRKGAQGERETARDFRDAWPDCDAQRRGGQQARVSDDAPDVDVPGLWLEVKRGKRPSPRAALLQAIDTARDDRTPVAVIRDDRTTAKDRAISPFVVLRLDDFFELVRPWWEQQQR